jgi:hypothetical protein
VEQTCSIRVSYDAKNFSSIIVAVCCVGIESESLWSLIQNLGEGRTDKAVGWSKAVHTGFSVQPLGWMVLGK